MLTNKYHISEVIASESNLQSQKLHLIFLLTYTVDLYLQLRSVPECYGAIIWMMIMLFKNSVHLKVKMLV